MVIYKTTNLINGKFYVGKDVKNQKHYLGSGVLLKKAIEKYGVENFKKEILEECSSIEELEERERYWINKLNSIKLGYNITEGGTGGDTWTNSPKKLHWNLGRRPWNFNKKTPEETKLKISKSRKGKMLGGNKTSYKPGKDHIMYGKKQDISTIKKRVETIRKNGSYIGTGKFAPKKVKNIEDGKTFNSIKEAAQHYNVSRDVVGHSCRKQTNSGKFRFLDE